MAENRFRVRKSKVEDILFDTTITPIDQVEGLMQWNETDGTLDLTLQGGTVTQQIGQELLVKCRNDSDALIENGTPVYISGRQGNRPKIFPARSDVHGTAYVFGVATEDIADNSDGYITTFGYVRQIKTNYSGTGVWGSTWQESDNLYVSKTISGQLTNVEPDPPHHSDVVGQVGVVGSAGVGSIFINIRHHTAIEELSDVNGTPLTTNGQLMVWDNDSGYFDFDYNINDFALTGDLSSYATIDYVTGISGDLQSQIDTLDGATGDYVLKSETGSAATLASGVLLDRANHTGTQTLSTISDAGTIASFNSGDFVDVYNNQTINGEKTFASDIYAQSNAFVGTDLTVTGDVTLNSGLYLNNAKPIYWKDNGGTYREIFNFNANNDLVLGSNSVNNTYFQTAGNVNFRTNLGQPSLYIDTSTRSIEWSDRNGSWDGESFGGSQVFQTGVAISGDLGVTGNLNISSNIVVDGTVDGRDVAADGSTLDSLVAATGSYVLDSETGSAATLASGDFVDVYNAQEVGGVKTFNDNVIADSKIGVGVDSPVGLVHTKGLAAGGITGLLIENTFGEANKKISFRGGGTATEVGYVNTWGYTNPSFPTRMEFGVYNPDTTSTEKVLTLKQGKAGFGTDNPAYYLDVTGDGRFGTDLIVGSNLTVTGNTYITGNLGVGTSSPSAKIHSLSTSEQLRLGYDASNYLSFTVDSAGELDVDSTNGEIRFNSSAFIFEDSTNHGTRATLSSNDLYLGFGASDAIVIEQGGPYVAIRGTPSASYDFEVFGTSYTQGDADFDANVNITSALDVGTNCSIGGHLSAATKSFLIDNPTKEGKKLQYGVVESDQHSVFVRGKTDQKIIELPEEWEWLVHEDSVTVQLTPVGKSQQLYIIEQNNKIVHVGGVEGEFNYTIYGERKDVAKLETEV